jgi:hypothetical protein
VINPISDKTNQMTDRHSTSTAQAMTETYRWEDSCGEWYEPLKSTAGWDLCPNCGEFPRTWVFNNGNYAKCRCQHRWGPGVKAESVIEACSKKGVPYQVYKDYLRAAWNEHVSTLSILTPQAGEVEA